MKKVLIITISLLFLILLSLSVSAQTVWPAVTPSGFPDPTIVLHLDNDCTDAMGEQDCSSNGTFNTNTPFGSGSSHSLNVSGTQRLDTNFQNIALGGSYTISFWVRPSVLNDFGAFAGRGQNGVSTDYWFWKAGTKLNIATLNGGQNPKKEGSNLVVDEWIHMILLSNGSTETNLTWYLNGSDSQLNVSAAGNTGRVALNYDLYLMGDSSGNLGNINGLIDEVIIWNETRLNHTQLEQLWSGDFTEATGDIINISTPLPTTNTQYSFSTHDINATVNSTYAFNASLYIGKNGATPTLNQTITGYSSTFNNDTFVNFTRTLGEGNWTYYFNISSGDYSEKTDNQYFYIDTVAPGLAWGVPSLANNTIVWENINSNITAYDENIYSVYYNLTDTRGSLIYNFSNNSLYNTTDSFRINLSYPIRNYSKIIHATAKVCDGHTNELINFDTVSRDGNKIIFEEVEVYMDNQFQTNDLSYTYRTDRYSFSFETASSLATLDIIVESDNKIDIISGSSYPGHLITGDKWVDFSTDDLKGVSITRITDNKVKVTVNKNRATTTWNFNSIGELNCYTEKAMFLPLNTTKTYQDNVLSGQETTFYLNISYNVSYFTSAPTATLWYNNSGYSTTATPFDDRYVFSRNIYAPSTTGDVGFNWSYKVNGATYWVSNETQTITSIDIDNCSSYTNRFVNFSIRDELNNTNLTGYLEYNFGFSLGNFSGTYNGTTAYLNHFPFCLSPIWANFTTNMTIQYTTSGSVHGTRDYLAEGFIVDNETNQITLYALQTGEATAITVHVINDDEEDLENVLVEAYHYDISEDQDKLVETEYTDSEGNAILNLKTGTEYYSFRFYVNGVLKLSTTRFKLFATSYEYTLGDVRATYLGDKVLINNRVTGDIDYSNETNVVNFTWSTDLTTSKIKRFCLNLTFGNGSMAHSSCSESMNGYLNFTITTFNVTYMARGLVETINGFWFVLDTKSINTLDGWRTFLTNGLGLVLALITFLTIALIGVGTGNKDIAIGCAVGALIMIALFQITPLTISMVVGGIGALAVIILIVMNRRGT